MKRKEKEERFASMLPVMLHYHQTMLMDGVRNKLLFEAIKANVTADTAFLDIGAGTGVWAILAAKLGARRVVAVEIEETLIPIIYKHAAENGVAGRIEIIHGNIDHVRLRGKFDVIVSELFGPDAFYHETLQSFKALYERFLAPGGVLIPQKIARLAVPVRLDESVQNVPAELPVSCEFLKSLRQNISWNASFADREKIHFLAAPQQVIEIDFRNITDAPPAQEFSLSWELADLSLCNGLALFFNSTFTDEIKMDNFASRSWGATIYEFKPFEAARGAIKFDWLMDERKTIWTVSLPSDPQTKARTYSSAFAVTRAQMALQTAPYREVRAPKSKNKSKPANSKAKKPVK